MEYHLPHGNKKLNASLHSAVKVMINFCPVIAADGERCVVERCEKILLDVTDVGRIVIERG